jgi:predicted acylesterase/phospholipase RssA
VAVIGAATHVKQNGVVRSRLFDLKSHPSVHDGILGSALMPGTVPDWRLVPHDDGWLVDGGCTNLLPIRSLIAMYRPTDIIVFMNRGKNPSWNLLQRAMDSWHVTKGLPEQLRMQRILESWYVTKGLPERLRTSILRREHVLKRQLDYLRRRCEANWLLIFNDPDLSMLEKDSEILKDAVLSGSHFMTEILKNAGVT